MVMKNCLGEHVRVHTWSAWCYLACVLCSHCGEGGGEHTFGEACICV